LAEQVSKDVNVVLIGKESNNFFGGYIWNPKIEDQKDKPVIVYCLQEAEVFIVKM
jgi:hypothetical protein